MLGVQPAAHMLLARNAGMLVVHVQKNVWRLLHPHPVTLGPPVRQSFCKAGRRWENHTGCGEEKLVRNQTSRVLR